MRMLSHDSVCGCLFRAIRRVSIFQFPLILIFLISVFFSHGFEIQAATIQLKEKPQIKPSEPTKVFQIKAVTDLQVQDITLDNNTPVIGSNLKVRVTVLNLTNTAAANIQVRCSYQGKQYNNTISKIGGKRRGVASFELKITGNPGTHIVEAEVNPTKSMKESHYNNNKKSKRFNVKSGNRIGLSKQPNQKISAAKISLNLQEIPDIKSIKPPSVQRGMLTIVELKGQNITAQSVYDFGDCITVAGEPISGDRIRLPIQVAQDCRSGLHEIQVKLGSKSYTASAKLRVIGGENSNTSSELVPNGIAAIKQPDILRVTPENLKPGKEYDIRMRGKNVTSKHHFDFGSCIQQKGIPKIGDEIRVQVQVDKKCNPGKQPIIIKYGPKKYTATAAFNVLFDKTVSQIEEKEKLQKIITPILVQEKEPKNLLVRSISPNQWKAGFSYQVQITGKNFVEGMAVDLGKRVEITDIVVTSASSMSMKLEIGKNAKPGMRSVKLQLPDQGEWQRFTASGWVVSKDLLSIKKPQLKLEKPNWSVFTKGKINLLTPHDPSDVEHYKNRDYIINERTQFTWSEQNPGLAEWFEFRIVAEDGYIIDSKKIEKANMFAGSVPCTFSMSTDYLFELLTGSYPTFEGSNGGDLANKRWYWEVAGFKRVAAGQNQNTTSKSKQTISIQGNTNQITSTFEDVEVEISERRPIYFPKMASGLACSANINSHNTEVSVINNSGGSRGASYPGDEFKLVGKRLDISSVPYQTIFSHNGVTATVADNIFLDWGDGSEPIPLEVDISSNQPLLSVPLTRPYWHVYERPGDYIVRIYILPLDDIQGGAPNGMASLYDTVMDGAQASTAGQQMVSYNNSDPYYTIVKQNNFASNSDVVINENSFLAMGERAHLLYCKSEVVEPVEDLVATGPLNLESIVIEDYNGNGSSSADPKLVKSSKKIVSLKNKEKAKIRPKKQNLTVSQKKNTVSFKSDATFSPCDIVQGNGRVKYFGEGHAKVTWSLTGNGINHSWSEEKALASLPRDNLDEASQNVPTEDSYSSEALQSDDLDLAEFQMNNLYSWTVNARVLPEKPKLSKKSILNIIDNGSVGDPVVADHDFRKELFSWLIPNAEAAGFTAGGGGAPQLNSIKKAGVKLSVLAPSKEASFGRPVTASLNKYAQVKNSFASTITRTKPYFVESSPFTFKVVPSTPEKPCRFSFPTSDNERFVISNLEVTGENNTYSGQGSLKINLYTGQGSEPSSFILPIAINNWKIHGDGETVLQGQIDSALNFEISDAGMRMRLKKLEATAGTTPMQLTLQATPADTMLRLPGSTSYPEWEVTAPLTILGDWFGKQGDNTKISVGYTGFYLIPQEIVIDLSATEGLSKNPNGAAAGWAGLHFGNNATLLPNLFGFDVKEEYKGKVSDWGVVGTDLVGKSNLAINFNQSYKKGNIKFSSISVDTTKTNFAHYNNLDVYVPWLDINLQGDVDLVSGEPGKESYFDFSEIQKNQVQKEYDNISMTVNDLLFGRFQSAGWGVWSENTTFAFSADGVIFAQDVIVPGVIYSMDGYPSLESGTMYDVPLGGKSYLGATPLDLGSVTVELHSDQATPFRFKFDTTFNLSEKLPAAQVPVKYNITKSNQKYRSEGPLVTPFDVVVAFPEGQPKVESTIHLEYSGGGLSSDMSSTSFGDWWPFGVSEAYAASTAQDSFYGTVDMSMFGLAPIDAEFRLGYLDGHDYWIIRAAVDLGASGVPFAPPYLKLFKIRGGLGHNFPLDAFRSTGPLTSVSPITDGSFLFMAGMRVATSDGFTATMDGDLTIKPGDGARMDFRAWLLDYAHEGDGDFQGYLQYAAGGFDGALQGHLGLLEDLVYVDIPMNSCEMHFGGGKPWYIYVGKDTGPKVNMHMIFSDNPGYMMLDDDSFRFGASSDFYLGCSIGHVQGSLATGVVLTPAPHIAGYIKGDVSAEVCIYGECVGTGIWVQGDVSALPLAASVRGCVEIPIPFWNPDVCRTFSL